jgi:hypothetical protein
MIWHGSNDMSLAKLNSALIEYSLTHVCLIFSNPLVALASKNTFRLLLLFIAGFCVYRVIMTCKVISRAGIFSADIFRFRPLQLRSSGILSFSNSQPESEFGLLRDGCRVQRTHQANGLVEFTYNNTGFEWRLSTTGSKLNANGYFLNLSTNSALDPIRWIVEGSNDNGSTWIAIGASTWRMNPDGAIQIYSHLPSQQTMAAVSSAERAVVNVDMRPSLSWALTNCIGIGVAGICLTCCALAACFGRIGIYMAIFKSMYVMVTMLWLIAVLYTGGSWMWRESLVIWLRLIPKLPGTLLLIFYDPWLLYVFVFWGISDLFLCILIEGFLYDLHGSTLVQILVASSLAWIHLIFAAAVFLFRTRAIKNANKIILEDQQRYNMIWATERSKVGATSAILELTNECSKLLAGCQNTVPRQLKITLKSRGDLQEKPNPASSSHKAALFTLCNTFFSVGDKCPQGDGVDSLDQLFVQAWCLEPFLVSKAKTWADASRGYFPLSDKRGFVLYSSFNGNLEKQIKWGKVKAVHRSIEKVMRVYKKVSFCQGAAYNRSIP